MRPGKRFLPLLAALFAIGGCGGGGAPSGDDGSAGINDGPTPGPAPAGAPPALAIDTASYQLVSSVRIARTIFEYTYLVNVVNSGGAATGVHATVHSAATATVVVDGEVDFGDVAAGSVATSVDTFTIRQDRATAFNSADLSWAVTADAPPASFDLVLETPTISGFTDGRAAALLRVERHDGFSGDITIGLQDPPPGITSPGLLLTAGVGSDGVLVLDIADTVAAGDVALAVLAQADGLSRSAALTLTVQPPQPSAQQLIRQAVAAGSLERATSLVYRAYARIDDPRLPAQFRGSGSEAEDPGLDAEILGLLPDLSPDSRALLEPFLRRPSDPGGWYAEISGFAPPPVSAAGATARPAAAKSEFVAECTEGATHWISRVSTQPVRVWAECVADDPGAAAAKIERALRVVDAVWEEMVSDMGPAIPDIACENPCDGTNPAGDSRIDLYIVMPGSVLRRSGQPGRLGAGAWAPPWTSADPRGDSGFIVFPESSLNSPIFQTNLVHEAFHILQYAHYKAGQLDAAPTGGGGTAIAGMTLRWWFIEASAEWAGAYYERFIDLPDGHTAGEMIYRPFFPRFQARGPGTALNIPGTPVVSSAIADPSYAGFIWPYFIWSEVGIPPIFDTWKGLTSQMLQGGNGAAAADQLLDSKFSFADHFREFAVRNLNISFDPGDALPRTDRHVNRDSQFQVVDQLMPKLKASLLKNDDNFPFDIDVAPLAAQYTIFGLDMDAGKDIKKVVFDLAGVHGAGLKVDAFVKIRDRDWERRNLDSDEKLTFCFDDPPRRFEYMYLIVSDPRLQPYTGTTTKATMPIKATIKPCKLKYAVTVNGDHRYENPGSRTHVTTAANMELDYSEENSTPNDFTYLVDSGNFSYQADIDSVGRTPACHGTGTASGNVVAFDPLQPFADNTAIGGISAFIEEDGTSSSYAVIEGNLFATVKSVSNCNDLNEEQTDYLPGQMITWWQTGYGDEFGLPLGTEGANGSWTSQDGNTSYDWTLRKVWVDE